MEKWKQPTSAALHKQKLPNLTLISVQVRSPKLDCFNVFWKFSLHPIEAVIVLYHHCNPPPLKSQELRQGEQKNPPTLKIKPCDSRQCNSNNSSPHQSQVRMSMSEGEEIATSSERPGASTCWDETALWFTRGNDVLSCEGTAQPVPAPATLAVLLSRQRLSTHLTATPLLPTLRGSQGDTAKQVGTDTARKRYTGIFKARHTRVEGYGQHAIVPGSPTRHSCNRATFIIHNTGLVLLQGVI